jgi:tRNA (guanine37-N1)-methyltransferase
MANYDILGDIAIIKFNEEVSTEQKIAKAGELMQQYKCLKTVLEKTNKVSGRLRTIKTNFLLGKNKKETLYKENGCSFKLNVESCYFSPRLANERLEVAKLIAKYSEKNKIKNPSVLVMFSGVAPFPIVIAKTFGKKIKEIVSVELGKDCEKYAIENIKINKLDGKIKHLQGDVKKIIPKLLEKNKKERYDFIIMPRPNLKETFLKQGLMMARKNTIIIYYGFSPEAKKQSMVEELEKEAKNNNRKIKILSCLEAGDIAPFEHRYRIEIKVLS